MDIELLKGVLTLRLMLGALEKIIFAAPTYLAALLDRRERARAARRDLARRFPNLSPGDRLRRQRPVSRGKG